MTIVIVILLFLILLCLLPRSAWSVIGTGLATLVFLWIAADISEQGWKLPVWLCVVFIGLALLGGVVQVVEWTCKVSEDEAFALIINATKRLITEVWRNDWRNDWRSEDKEGKTAIAVAILCPTIFLLGAAAFLAWPA